MTTEYYTNNSDDYQNKITIPIIMKIVTMINGTAF